MESAFPAWCFCYPMLSIFPHLSRFGDNVVDVLGFPDLSPDPVSTGDGRLSWFRDTIARPHSAGVDEPPLSRYLTTTCYPSAHLMTTFFSLLVVCFGLRTFKMGAPKKDRAGAKAGNP